MPQGFFPPQLVLRRLTQLAVAVLVLAAAQPAVALDAAGVWTPLGPSGGTVSALAVDPADGNIVYAGAQYAGVFRSTNGGRSWQPALDGGGVPQIAVSPGTRTVYAFSGGFFSSRDRGVSWASLAPGLAAAGKPYGVAFAVSPTPGTVFAIALSQSIADAVIVRSTDDGDSWRVVFVPPSGTSLLRVWTDPTDPRFVFATTLDQTYRSEDGGSHWLLAGLGGAAADLAVEAGPRHRLLAYLDDTVAGSPVASHLAVSSDRGRTWRARDTLGDRPLVFLRADPTAPGTFLAATFGGGLFRTADAGLHWTSLGLAPFDGTAKYRYPLDLAFDPHRPGVAYLAVRGGDLGRTVWKTASSGAAWTPFNRGLFAGTFTAVAVDPRDPATLWAAADPIVSAPSGLWKSSDRGATWTAAGFLGEAVYGLTFGGGGDSLFGFVSGRGIERSDDGGQHWAPLAIPPDGVFAFVNPPEEPDTLYVLSSSGLRVSRDGGATWAARPLAAGLLLAAPGAPATLYANLSSGALIPHLAMDGVQRSTDRGATWTTILPSTDGTVASIGLDPADPRRLVVARYRRTVAGPLRTEILTTADGGATWSPGVLPPEAMTLYKILPDPLVLHGFLASTGEGAFASADGGATWSRLGAGLPRISTWLSLDPSSPRTVYAATAGGGVYRLERTVP